jgi:hypothetical protein
MKMKIFIISVFACFLIMLNSCNSTEVIRHDYSIPVKGSSILKISEGYFTGGNVVIDGKRIDAGYINVDYIISAGRHDIYSRRMARIASGGQSGYRYEFVYEGKKYYSDDRFFFNIQGSFEFENGKFYEFSSEWIDVTHVSGYLYTDEDGNLYQGNYELDEHGLYHFMFDTILPYFSLEGASGGTANVTVTHRLWRIVIKEIEGRSLGKTYIVTDKGPTIGVGIRYPNMLMGEFAPLTFGFSLYSGPVDVTVYGKAGVGVGFGVRDYKFNDFKSNVIVGAGVIPLGVDAVFYNGKFGMGIGGGYLLGQYVSPGNDESYFERKATPYLQLKFGRPHEGNFYIDYYPGVMPIYSAFGMGVLWRW